MLKVYKHNKTSDYLQGNLITKTNYIICYKSAFQVRIYLKPNKANKF